MFRLLSAIVFLFSCGANAAVLILEGAASVDKGAGFAPAANNTSLNPGDRVRATAGCASIVYDNGYRTKVCSGRMAVVMADEGRFAGGSLKDPDSCPPGSVPAQVSLKDGVVCQAQVYDPVIAAGMAAAGVGLAVGISQIDPPDPPSP